MTPTEQARRSDSLHYDNVSRRQLCDMVAAREADIDKLKDLCSELQVLLFAAHDGLDDELAVDDAVRRMEHFGIEVR